MAIYRAFPVDQEGHISSPPREFLAKGGVAQFNGHTLEIWDHEGVSVSSSFAATRIRGSLAVLESRYDAVRVRPPDAAVPTTPRPSPRARLFDADVGSLLLVRRLSGRVVWIPLIGFMMTHRATSGGFELAAARHMAGNATNNRSLNAPFCVGTKPATWRPRKP